MNFESILFNTIDESTRKVTSKVPAYFVDLNLNQIVDAVTANRDSYNLKPFFYTPLHDEATIHYRHEIMRELENETLMENIKSYA